MESTWLSFLLVALWMTAAYGAFAALEFAETEGNHHHLRALQNSSEFRSCLDSCARRAAPTLLGLLFQPCKLATVSLGVGFGCEIECGKEFPDDPLSPCASGCSFDNRCVTNVTVMGAPIGSVADTFDLSKLGNSQGLAVCETTCNAIKALTKSFGLTVGSEDTTSTDGQTAPQTSSGPDPLALGLGLGLGLGIPALLVVGYFVYTSSKASTASEHARADYTPQDGAKTQKSDTSGPNQYSSAHVQKA